MARIRSIKPEFFLHEELAELSPLARLFFIGLWTLADKAGRLEDRPKRIKAAILPWEDCDVDALLWDLADAGFIERYESGGLACIQIPGFIKHQRPHPKESSHDLPEPGRPGGREKKRPSPEIKRQAMEKFSTIPSSPPGKEIFENGLLSFVSGGGGGPEAIAASPPPPPEVPELTIVPDENSKALQPEDLQRLWNELKAPEMPNWREMPPDRRTSAKARLKERPHVEGDGGWREVISRLARSKFATGKESGRDGKTWIADPEFLLRPGAATKVLEGKYDSRKDHRKGVVRAEDSDFQNAPAGADWATT